MKDQLPIPFLKAEGGQQTVLKHCKLPGGCLEDWSLSYLTQISDGEKQQPLVMKAAVLFITDVQIPGSRDDGWKHTIDHLKP